MELPSQDTNSSGPASAPGVSPDQAALRALEAKINAMLPPRYQGCYASVSPTSMGSAGLKFAADGTVAWNEIWTHFCDLALAGGPPHRGTWLGPVSDDAVRAEPEKSSEVAHEIARGVWLVTGLPVLPRIAPGWVGVNCRDPNLAAWLVRAVVAENVAARHRQSILHVPAGPQFRLEKEVKNVITAVAKTCHYRSDHMKVEERTAADDTAKASHLVEPAEPAEAIRQPADYQRQAAEIGRGVTAAAGLPLAPNPAVGWVGGRCESEGMAVWLTRAVIVENILSRRERDVVFVPVCLRGDPGANASRVVEALANARRMWEVSRRPAGQL